MEDILASIRRILSEDGPASEEPTDSGPPSNVLVLDDSMLAPDEMAPEEEAMPSETKPPADPMRAAMEIESSWSPAVEPPEPVAPPPIIPPPPIAAAPPPIQAAPQPAPASYEPDMSDDDEPSLLAPEAQNAASMAMAGLLRSLGTERALQTHRGGPTIEDIVREELRPLLKLWLDEYLPPMVERVVRSEIERLAGRLPG